MGQGQGHKASNVCASTSCRTSSLENSVNRKLHHFVSLGFRLPKEFNDPTFSTVTIERDFFYGYDTLMENVSDPSHIEFAHYKVNAMQIFENEFTCLLYKVSSDRRR